MSVDESVPLAGLSAPHPEDVSGVRWWAAWPDWKIALALTLVLRVVYSAFAAIASLFLHPSLARIHSNAFTSNLPAPHGWRYAFLGIWARFDTLWYLHISAHGYDLPASTVFYPLYPALIRFLSSVVDPLFAALLISTASSFFLFWGFLLVAGHDFSRPIALRSLLLYTAWPVSFVFFAGYTESLCGALVLWAIHFAQKSRWWVAVICAILAGLSRPSGALVFVPLLVLALRQKQLRSWPVLLASLGGPAYLGWLHWAKHISYRNVYGEYWNTNITWPWNTLWDALAAVFHSPNAARVASILVLLGFCLVITIREMRLEYRLYCAAVVVQILMANGPHLLVSSIRYVLLMFPVFIELGVISLKKKTALWFICFVLILFNVAWLWGFLNWSHVL